MRVALQLDAYAQRAETLHHDRETALAIVQELYEAAYKEGYKDAQQDCAEEEEN